MGDVNDSGPQTLAIRKLWAPEHTACAVIIADEREMVLSEAPEVSPGDQVWVDKLLSDFGVFTLPPPWLFADPPFRGWRVYVTPMHQDL